VSRTERLLELLQVLRRHRSPIPGPALAAELGISIRTLYRDIATLQAQGAQIQGEPGLGYVLRPGFTLPPLMFSVEELEALVLGSRWVAARSEDRRLGDAARNALAKIAAVLPDELRREVNAATLLIGPAAPQSDTIDTALVRESIRREHKLQITYRDADGRETARVIWPIAIGFFDRARLIVAFCELRQGFRHFRVDRVASLGATGKPYPRRRVDLLAAWREQEGVADTAVF
jgi:predicted DNA-binding transcriptional regulator YafY